MDEQDEQEHVQYTDSSINLTVCAAVISVVGLLFILHKWYKSKQKTPTYRAVNQEDVANKRLSHLDSRFPPSNPTSESVRHRSQSASAKQTSHKDTVKPSTSNTKIVKRPSEKVQERSDPGPNVSSQPIESPSKESQLKNVQSPPSVQPTDKDNAKPVKTSAPADSSDKSKQITQKNTEPAAKPEITMSVEDQILQLLSTVLDCKVVMRSKAGSKPNPHTLLLKPSELPADDRVASTCDVLFERRLIWESVGQVALCCRCYNVCVQQQLQQQQQGILGQVLTAVKQKAVHGLLASLQQEDELAIEEGIWSDFSSDVAGANNRSEYVEFLYRIAGQSTVTVGRDLLHDLLTLVHESEDGYKVIRKVIHAGVEQVQKQRFDELASFRGILQGFEVLFGQPAILPILAGVMDKETKHGTTALGSYFEQESMLGPLFSVSTVSPDFREMTDLRPSSTNPSMPWLQMRNFPNVAQGDLALLESQVYDCLHSLQSMLHKLFVRLIRQHKESTLAWLATLLNMNEVRVNVNANPRPDPDHIQATCTDGFMLNFVHLMIELSLKVFVDASSRSKISPSYYTSPSCRINMAATACLAGGQITRDECLSRADGCGSLSPEHRDQYKFHTEIVVLALRAINLGFFPAKSMFNKFTQLLDRSRAMQQIDMNTPAGEAFKRTNLIFRLRWECVLMDAELTRKGSEFFLGISRWISELLESTAKASDADSKRAQCDVFVHMPQYIVRDMGEWFWFVTTYSLHRHKGALDGLELTPFVDVCVTLLRRQDLQCGPIAATNLIKALHSFVSSNKHQPQTAWNQSWGSSALAHGELLVYSCPAVKQHLARALLHTYISVDVVEGLDVSKDDFDKFAARSYIGRLLESMWERQDMQQAIIQLCTEQIFQDFLWCVLDFLLFPQHEAFKQLASIKKLEKEIEQKSSWESLPAPEREEKLKLLQGDQYFAAANNRSVSDLLHLIDLLSQNDAVAKCFTKGKLSSRSATAFLEFFENLCGPKAAEHKVKDMDKYNFDPRSLLAVCTDILLRIVYQDSNKEAGVRGFVQCLALDPLYSDGTMQRALGVLRSGKVAMAGASADKLETLLLQITIIQGEHQSEFSQSEGAVSWQQQYMGLTVDEEELDNRYKESMMPLVFRQAAILDSHVHRAKALAANAGGQQVKRIVKEMETWMKDLPMTAQAAVFIRQDTTRMDVVRCVVTGPMGSPYAFGCFLFDVYFPATYPEHAPVIKHLTTGNNTVRFSHNLYEDGKVCLSLLGFAEGSETEKWMKEQSSLYQVLLSIQSIILVPDAMYRDPRFEGLRGLEEGKKREAEYNTDIRISSLRYTMLDMLRKPPQGCEVVIRNHFRVMRSALLTTACNEWLKECPDEHKRRQMTRFVDELVMELDKLGDDMEEEAEEEEDSGEEEEEEEDEY